NHMATTPDVFIVESLRFIDEKKKRQEGSLLAHVLNLAERECQYFYIRTRKEFEKLLNRFARSQFRYLHISCHADTEGIELTLDGLNIQQLGSLLRPYIKNRRIFF